MSFEDFILAHDADDLGRLALARERFSREVEDFDLALTTLECRRKLKTKVPEWYAQPGLWYPLRLSAEQCSSSETARYKAFVAQTAVGGGSVTQQGPLCATGGWRYAKSAQNALRERPEWLALRENGPKCVMPARGRLADLTGGLGVDAWAFSQAFGEVLYNEMQPGLARAAEHNFRELGVENVTVRNCEVVTGSVKEVLAGFDPDIIYLDPARRAGDGRKVFRLEDCSPDVFALLPELLSAAPRVLLKLSPMADISLVRSQLSCVKEVHVVAAEGECKELLLLLERDYAGACSTIVYESGAVMVLHADDFVLPVSGDGCVGTAEPASVGEAASGLTQGGWLFEPGKALLKAGAFGLPCRRFGLAALDRHTHLYVSARPVPEELAPFGKCFCIQEVLPLNGRSIKDLGKRIPRAEVTARNIPLSSDALRERLGVRSGGDVHIFGARLGSGQNVLIVTALPHSYQDGC